MEKMKRIVSMLLCIAMCISMVPVQAFAAGTDETTEYVNHDHDHDHGEEAVIVPTEEETLPGQTTQAGDSEMRASVTATCSHSYTYTYAAAGHTQHTKTGTCSKCSATTTAKENHTWSGSQCSLCGCYKPITANGTYDVIGASGIQLYSENNSGSTKVKVVAKGSTITVTSVAATSSGYYWGKVTKVGTTTQSTTAWVCMKSSELGTHSHSYSYAYEVTNHSQHTKNGTCSKCGATTTAKESHTWSDSRCSSCGCYKPITSNGTYDVIATSGIQLYSENNSSSTKVKVVAKGSTITVTSVGVTSSGYYWGKVTKVGTTTQSTSAWVCMKSSDLGTHSHSYSYAYEVTNHSQHTKNGTCSKCGATTSAKENHTWSDLRCSSCGCYRPLTADGIYDVISSDGIQLYSESNSSSTKVKVVAKGSNITVTNVAATGTGYYWGKVTKVGATTQTTTAWVCMRSSDLQEHAHSLTKTYTDKSDSQHNVVSLCACGYSESTVAAHSWSGGKCSLCGRAEVPSKTGGYVTTRESEALRADVYSSADSPLSVPEGTYIEISQIITNSYGNYWGKVATIDGEAPATTLYAYMGNLKAHSHSLSTICSNVNNVEHDSITTCSGCNYTKKTRGNHSFSGGECTVCGGWQAYSADGDYIIINADGVKVYSQRITSGTSQELDTLPKGTYVRIVDVKLNDAKNYWGKVERIGNKTPSQTMYIYLGRGQVQPHTHSYTKTYSEKSDSQHNVISTCTCGYKLSVVEGHSWSGGKCILCGVAEVPHVAGGYVTTRTSEALRADMYSDSDSPKSVPKGTYIEISQVYTNSFGNYWGKVGSIDGEAPASTMYAYMGHLIAHTHSLETTSSNVNNMEHDETTICSGCNYTKKVRTGHSWSGGKCSVCGGWQAHSANGDYIVINADGVKAYSQRITSGTSQDLKTLPEGTYVRVTEVKLNDAKNYWGKVERIDNETPSQTMYIYMGSGQVQPHTHSLTATYNVHRDQWHTEQSGCTGCAYVASAVKKDHSFVDGACKYCGHAEVPSTPGIYVPYRASEPLREEPRESATAPDKAEKGNYLNITEVSPNEYGNYWGKVTVVGSRTLAKPLYVYMGNVTAHIHSLSVNYGSANNLTHKKTSYCACGFTEIVRESHSWSGETCSLCGALDAYKAGGTYLIINEKGVWTYSRPITSGDSDEVELLRKASYIEVVDVKTNSADNYWGKVVSVNGQPRSQVMYIYMGRGQVQPHTHTMDTTYTSKSDSQHYKNDSCPACGFTQTEPTVEDHTFAGGSCAYCGKEEVFHEPGLYVTVRNLETLRLEPYEASDKAEKLSSGTCLEIESVLSNKYGNYWGIVKSIDGVAPEISPTYAYLGNLKAHTHSWSHSYSGVNNLSHDWLEVCDGCNMRTLERQPHDFSDGWECSLCTAWQAYEEDGDYITVKDAVPVYSRNLTSPEDSRVLDSLPKDTFLQVVDVDLNSANNYWGRVVRVGNKEISGEMYIYMGRGQLQPHSHTMDTTYKSKSDTQHEVNSACTVCGYTKTQATAEDHTFSGGVCTLCGVEEVAHSGDLYVTVRERETLRADRYSDSSDMGGYPKGTALTVTDIKTNKYGNWWAKVVKINDAPVQTTCYTYLGNLRPHTHSFTTTIESVSNQNHKIVTACPDCNTRQEVREAHDFAAGVCSICQAWEPNYDNGGYVTINPDGVPLYSKDNSDKSKGSQLLKTLPAGTYIEVEKVRPNTAGNYWGKVTAIGNYAEKQTMYVYMGRGQLEVHNPQDHTFSNTYESINNQKHEAYGICTTCDYTQRVEEDHKFGDGEHNACKDCGAWKPNTLPGGYLTIKEDVELYSKRSSDTKKGSKVRKILPAGSYLEIVAVEPNPAGNYWGKVTTIDNEPAEKTMYVYMGSGSLEPHTHQLLQTLISASDTQHTYGSRCTECAVFTKDTVEDHLFSGDSCTVCGKAPVTHVTGCYVTVRETESLRADIYSNTKEVEKVPAGTLIEVSKVVTNKYGNYWGKVSKINGKSVGRKTMYTYLGNLEYHPSHTMQPYWETENDQRHQVGEKCEKCNHVTFTGKENHTFGSDNLCTKCGKAAVSMDTGNYVTFRASEPLRASASKDAKSLQNVPAGTRLQIGKVTENDWGNLWGVVSQIDGTYTTKTMYVYMGNVLRHETHDMQSFCDRVSDTRHSSGLRCTGCNLTKNTQQNDHSFGSDGLCTDCGAKEIPHGAGGYLVRVAGNLKKGMGQNTGDVQWAAENDYLVVTSITTNDYGNWWGRVTTINGVKPKMTNAYVYLGNLVPHEHAFVLRYAPKDHNSHTMIQECADCGYREELESRHAPAVNGKCPSCQAEIPLATTKGDYETFREVTLYQDKNLTKPAGILVEAGYLVRITSVKQVKDKDGNVIFSGKLSQYGEAPAGKDSLYVNMADITPHLEHDFTEGYWSRCDAYHYWSHACSLVGCTANRKGTEERHDFGEGACRCGKTQVFTTEGVYRVRGGSELALHSKRNSSGSPAAYAPGGSIIVVEEVKLNSETGNYWGEVIWYDGKTPGKTMYVYMGSLVAYTRSASATVAGSDQSFHYLRDKNEIFPEKHNFQNGVCESCAMVKDAPATGLYIVRNACRAYTKSSDRRAKLVIKANARTFQKGSVLRLRNIQHFDGVWYGIVTSCDGSAVKGISYVQLDDLTYHGEHVSGSEHWVRLNDKQHTYDVNCPVCGTDSKSEAAHVFDEQGACLFCGEAQPFTEKGDCFLVVRQINVYKSDSTGSTVLETLPRGTVLKVDSVTEKGGFYMGTGVQILEDGKLTAHKGYIRMSRTWLSVHEHSWGAEKMTASSEAGHTITRNCTVCGLQDQWTVEHNRRACQVCGAKAIAIGSYTVAEDTATVYKKDLKKVYAQLKEGDFVDVTKIISSGGIYWGKAFRIGEKEIKEEVYIPMGCLKSHTHQWNYVLTGAEDNYHTYKATCISCGLTEQTAASHAYDFGKCAVCGKAVVPASTGIYVAAETLTVYKNPRQGAKAVAKNATISKGTHLYIREVKVETTMIQTEGDGSFYGEILWGKVLAAGSVVYSGEKWVRMGSLQEDVLHTKISYDSLNENYHTALYECEDHDCGLKGSIGQNHSFDDSGTCGLCGYETVKKGTYYTARAYCEVYNIPTTGRNVNMKDYAGTIRMAGTQVDVLKSRVLDGEQYCYIRISGPQPVQSTKEVWIARENLVDHRHAASGMYAVVDDEYHQVCGSAGMACRICGADIPELNSYFTESRHTFKDGYCKLCDMPEIPTTAGTYYAPYDGYYAYETRSAFAERGMEYKAGDKIVVTKDPVLLGGVYWGEVKNTGTKQYVMMRTLSTTPVTSAAEVTSLTDREVIDWCVNYGGATPFPSYNYYTEMLDTISDGDILLMAVNSRASSLTSQLFRWVEEACGETLAKKYYEGQIIAMLTALEEEADYSVSIPYKSEVKTAIKLATTSANWTQNYQGDLKKCDIEAISKLKGNLGVLKNLLDYGELGLELCAHMAMDYGRMEGIIETARAIQNEATDDPDLRKAFEDVITTYEKQYYLEAETLIKQILDLLAKKPTKWMQGKASNLAVALIKEFTGYDVVTGWSDWSFVYSTVNFAIDLGMQVTDAAKYSKSMLQFMSQINVMSASYNAYTTAVQNIQDGDHSAGAVAAVRRQFAAYKVSMVELYDTMMSMASNHVFGIGEDSELLHYLQYEKDKLESVFLINDLDRFVKGISFEEYKRTH